MFNVDVLRVNVLHVSTFYVSTFHVGIPLKANGDFQEF